MSGTARFIESALADVVPTQLGMFDKVLAINVNPFWVGGGPVEPSLVDRLLSTPVRSSCPITRPVCPSGLG